MLFSTLFFACSLSLSANAVRLAGSEISDVEPCAKALSSNLDCHERIAEFTPGDRGLYWDNEACTKACQQSIRDFHTAVYDNCPAKVAFQYGEFMSRGWNLTCDSDPETGKLCDISSYAINPPDNELSRKYLCWPCYARNILMSDIYETRLPLKTYKDIWEHQRERILKECPENIRDPTPFPDREALGLNTSRDVSMYPRTTERADPTTVSTQSTASAATTASSEPNAAETFGQGHLYLTFIFGMAVFYL